MMYKEGVIAATTISSIIYSWLIPSSLFIFINLVIATIFIISRFTSSSPKALIHDSLQILRSNPLLDRLSSFNNHQYTQTTESTQPQPVSPPSILERVKSFNLGLLHKDHETVHTTPESENLDDNPQEPKLDLPPLLLQQLQEIKEPEPGSEMEGLESKVSKSGNGDDDDDDDDDDEGKWLKEEKEIGVKADDFINMFKNQLRLQRVDSFNAYRDMLN
ncbi:PREDICTED: uncharacterized protein LOC109356049 isoform X1 [Lupinus angustifolius]|uniref:uncharacterized protein LOC109356049 isoform X1 n=1 Tax=Lupinus angustifolius TaxID=3871 RepID=UPI00092F9807|nr:PREDICTED: uncharacterized protein LOC109356049 isoform X1 [Lupinus angustifolius]